MARKKSANGDGTLSKRKDKDGNTIGWKGAIIVGHKANGTLDRRWIDAGSPARRRKM